MEAPFPPKQVQALSQRHLGSPSWKEPSTSARPWPLLHWGHLMAGDNDSWIAYLNQVTASEKVFHIPCCPDVTLLFHLPGGSLRLQFPKEDLGFVYTQGAIWRDTPEQTHAKMSGASVESSSSRAESPRGSPYIPSSEPGWIQVIVREPSRSN